MQVKSLLISHPECNNSYDCGVSQDAKFCLQTEKHMQHQSTSETSAFQSSNKINAQQVDPLRSVPNEEILKHFAWKPLYLTSQVLSLTKPTSKENHQAAGQRRAAGGRWVGRKVAGVSSVGGRIGGLCLSVR